MTRDKCVCIKIQTDTVKTYKDKIAATTEQCISILIYKVNALSLKFNEITWNKTPPSGGRSYHHTNTID